MKHFQRDSMHVTCIENPSFIDRGISVSVLTYILHIILFISSSSLNAQRSGVLVFGTRLSHYSGFMVRETRLTLAVTLCETMRWNRETEVLLRTGMAPPQ